MTSSDAKTPAELFDDFIKLEWQDIFRTERYQLVAASRGSIASTRPPLG